VAFHWRTSPNTPIDLPLGSKAAARIFISFACAYFISYAFRSINAVIAPDLIGELHISNSELGLLSAAYFIGFAITQLPIGLCLDRFGPRRTEMALMLLAIIGALIFAWADDFLTLLIGRVLIGMGVSACLMAAFSGFRSWFPLESQAQLASGMLVFGASGALMTSWPVHVLLPYMGWRGVFVAMAILCCLAIIGLYFGLPLKTKKVIDANDLTHDQEVTLSWISYKPILTNAFFWRIFPLGIFCYGGLIAIQTLWLGPWLTGVMEYSSESASQILFFFNAVLLIAYALNAVFLPKLAKHGITTLRYLVWMVGVSLILQACAFYLRSSWVYVWWYLLAVSCASYVLAQSLIVSYFPKSFSGRVSTTYNLTLFIGAFLVQWGIGYLIDIGMEAGWSRASAFDLALGLYLALQVIGYIWFLISPKFFPSAPISET
jgi:predicted MFS family arabinose efflux permease